MPWGSHFGLKSNRTQHWPHLVTLAEKTGNYLVCGAVLDCVCHGSRCPAQGTLVRAENGTCDPAEVVLQGVAQVVTLVLAVVLAKHAVVEPDPALGRPANRKERRGRVGVRSQL